MKPLFIAFEGIDGAGTTTQCQRLCDRLTQDGHTPIRTREPGGSVSAERIRDLVLDPTLRDVDAVTELLLIAASRRQHITDTIQPALDAGTPVITDRFSLSSYAYQGGGRGVRRSIVDQAVCLATSGLQPDLTLLLDLDVAVASSRRRSRREDPDRLEQEGEPFQQAVRQGYLQELSHRPHAIEIIDADNSEDVVEQTVYQTLIDRFPSFPFATCRND